MPQPPKKKRFVDITETAETNYSKKDQVIVGLRFSILRFFYSQIFILRFFHSQIFHSQIFILRFYYSQIFILSIF